MDLEDLKSEMYLEDHPPDYRRHHHGIGELLINYSAIKTYHTGRFFYTVSKFSVQSNKSISLLLVYKIKKLFPQIAWLFHKPYYVCTNYSLNL